MSQPITPDYTQQFLLPPSLEEWVPKDHPARFIREFVEQLDLAKLGFKVPACVEGRPPYAPELLLKIWLYGYLQRIRSTRKLEGACREHLSLLWLTGLLQPDHNSLWRFWRANQGALREVFKQTVQVAVRSGCVGLVVQAVDGTKIAAACSNRMGWSKEQMEKLLAALDEVLESSEREILGESDEEGPGYRLPAGLEERQALRDEIKAGLAQIQADGRSSYHRQEPEARRMKDGPQIRYCYNAQAVTDAKSGIITAAELTRQETDRGQLVPMIEQARENLGPAAGSTQTLADTGYGAGAEVQEAAAKGLSVLVRPAEGAPAGDNPYASQHFHYDPVPRTVTCPQKRTLDYEGGTQREHGWVERYRCHHRDCPVRGQCTRDAKGRLIEVHAHTPAVQAMRALLQQPQAQACYRLRDQIAERSFAQIKQHDQFRRFTVWGWQAARTQWALICAALNLRILYARWRSSSGTPPRPDPGSAALLRPAATAA